MTPRETGLGQERSHRRQMIEFSVKYETTGRMLKSKLSRTDRQTFRPRFRWEMLIHIWISPRHWKDASEEKRSLESDNLYVFLCL